MTSQDHILVVDDDDQIRSLVRDYLTESGFRVSAAGRGEEMWPILEADRVSLIVLDLMLPGEDGLSLCRTLRGREDTRNAPIIMLTARGGEADRVVGLELGADDYLTKPFSARELLARIKGLLRRARAEPISEPKPEPTRFRFLGWTLEVKAQQLLSPEGVVVDLSRGELELLTILLRHPGEVLSRDRIGELRHGRPAGPFDRGVDVLITRLRKRLREDPKEPAIIRTVWGKGYMLGCPVAAS